MILFEPKYRKRREKFISVELFAVLFDNTFTLTPQILPGIYVMDSNLQRDYKNS